MKLGRRNALNVLRVIAVRGMGVGLSLVVSILLAGRLGTTGPADTFFFVRNVVLELTEAFRRVLQAWLVPACVRAGPTRLRGLVNRWVLASLIFGGAFGALLAFASSWFVPLVVPGFDAERLALAGRLFHVCAPLIPALLGIAVLGAALNAARRFGLTEIAMIAPRAALLTALLVTSAGAGVLTFATAMVVGGIVGLGIVAVAWWGTAGPGPEAASATGTGQSSLPAAPLVAIILVQVYAQAALWMDYSFISGFAVGSVATVEYAQRLMLLLPGVVSSSIVTILYTEMAHRPGSTAGPAARAGRLGLFVTIPVVTVVAFFAHDLVDILLGHGRFTPEAVNATASLMRLYAPVPAVGMIANMVAISILLDPDLKRLRLLVPVYTLGLVARYGFLTVMTERFGLEGIPVAVFLSSLLVLCALILIPAAYRRTFLGRTMLTALAKLTVATAGLVLTCVVLAYFVPVPQAGVVLQLARVAVLGGIGVLGYLGLAFVLRSGELGWALSLLRR